MSVARAFRSMRRSFKRRWDADGTKLLGTVSGVLSGWQAIPDLIDKLWQPRVAALAVLIAALTVRRGYTNTNAQNPPKE